MFFTRGNVFRVASSIKSSSICKHCFIVRRSFSVQSQTAPTGPLTGIKVLDMSRILAGPYATMLLGDLGADIIKVEHPKTGDDTRLWGPPFAKHGESAYFLSINRNKRSIGVNIKHPKGQELIKTLARECDILVENFVPGKMDALSLGYEDLKRINPKLIYCSLTGYGSIGPDAHKTGYDVMISAAGGLLGITGAEEPAKVGVAITDITTGLYLHGAVMAALLNRQQTHKGQHLEVSLFGCQVAALANVGQNYLTAGQVGTRHGTAHGSIVPYQAFKAHDGFLVAGALNDAQFVKLCKAMNFPSSFAQQSDYKTNAMRVKNRVELLKRLEQVFITRTISQWLKVLEPAGISCSRVQTVQETFESEQVAALEMVQEVEHHTEGKIKLTGFPVKYSDESCKPQIRNAPPVLGQHTEEILSTFGYSAGMIQTLKDDDVIC